MIQIKSGRFLIILLFLLVSSLVSHAQSSDLFKDTSKVFIVANDDTVYLKPAVAASFPGGMHGWFKFLQKTLNANVPVNNGAPNGTYKIIIDFIIKKNGSISNITTETNAGYGVEQEGIRVILKSPHWIPATQNGSAVNSYKREPVTFIVSGDK
ncbi:MAG TPA: hypothetical protein VK559_10450 [Ferruginibacter sp.]|nr:hypothetical protein [Ferruginibacter sp.]